MADKDQPFRRWLVVAVVVPIAVALIGIIPSFLERSGGQVPPDVEEPPPTALPSQETQPIDQPADNSPVQEEREEPQRQEPPRQPRAESVKSPPGPNEPQVLHEGAVFQDQARGIGISVNFSNVSGREFASITIFPRGQKSFTRAARNPGTISFTVDTVTYYLNVMSIDFRKRTLSFRLTEARP